MWSWLTQPFQSGVRPTFGYMPIEEAEDLLQGLVLRNLRQLRAQNRSVLRAIRAGQIRYDRRDPGERYLSVDELFRLGRGDCEDLAAAVAAELQLKRPDLGAQPAFIKVNPRLYHVIVRLADGTTLDPSRMAGMS